jgi:hypothetical protein
MDQAFLLEDFKRTQRGTLVVARQSPSLSLPTYGDYCR